MTAKIKATGEEIVVEPYGDEFVQILPEGDYKVYTQQELSFSNDDIDWQHYRIQAAIAAIQGLVSNEIHLNHADKVAEEKGINTSTFLAKCAIDIADALVAELQKKQD